MTKFEPTKISSIKGIWEEEGFTFKKSFSQNFLIDQNIVDKILDAANVSEGDTVLEIGPGSGAMTLSMLQRGATVHAVEIDPLATKILTKYLSPDYNSFHLINEDILKVNLSFLPKGTKVVSNLPYHITSPIIGRLAEMPGIFTDIILMVQKEMADRIMAKAPSSNRSSFSLFTDYFFEKKSCFIVKPGCFVPKPKVDSVIISLKPKTELPLKHPEEFFTLVKKAFSQKRKMISSSLKEYPLAAFFDQSTIDRKSRPEQLSLEDFLSLYNFLSSGLNK